MVDTFSPQARSALMARIRSKDTSPEVLLRSAIHGMGYRFRLYRRDLPGKPDIVFPGRRKVIFVNGCFWHGHNCRRGRMPRSNRPYWLNKIETNKKRDALSKRRLTLLGWKWLVVWECELKSAGELRSKIAVFLDG